MVRWKYTNKEMVKRDNEKSYDFYPYAIKLKEPSIFTEFIHQTMCLYTRESFLKNK